MKPMTEGQKLLMQIACDEKKSEQFFISLGAIKWGNRITLVVCCIVSFVAGWVVGR